MMYHLIQLDLTLFYGLVLCVRHQIHYFFISMLLSFYVNLNSSFLVINNRFTTFRGSNNFVLYILLRASICSHHTKFQAKKFKNFIFFNFFIHLDHNSVENSSICKSKDTFKKLSVRAFQKQSEAELNQTQPS